MRRALIVYKDVFPNDAVGYDVIQQARCLRNLGWDTAVHAESAHPSVHDLVQRDPRSFLADESAVLIYHQAVLWQKGLELLNAAKCKRLVKYHNITPAHFFLPYSPTAYRDCLLARHQNQQIVQAGVDMVIADSAYNAQEFASYGLPEKRLRVLAPFNRIGRLSEVRPDKPVVDRLRDGKLNVLFVGRISPNKGHAAILHTAQAYKLIFGVEVRFILAGGMDAGLASYYEDLQRLATLLAVDDLIEFVGWVSDAQLCGYLMASHVFLVLSEHEGFCIPIIEAQACELPVLAREGSAIREVMGANQLVYEKEIGFEILASALRTLYEQRDMALYLARQGKRNAARYSSDRLTREFLECLEEVA